MTSNGDPAASNFTPQVGDDRSVIFDGVTNMNTENYFYLPTGDTVMKEIVVVVVVYLVEEILVTATNDI